MAQLAHQQLECPREPNPRAIKALAGGDIIADQLDRTFSLSIDNLNSPLAIPMIACDDEDLESLPVYWTCFGSATLFQRFREPCGRRRFSRR